MLVEIWSIGSKDSESYVLLTPHDSKDSWWVINGDYELVTNKKKHQVYIPYTEEYHKAYYLGDVEYKGDYNETICKYIKNKKIVSRNKVKYKAPKKDVGKVNIDDIAF